ncbi:hypothetical protein SLEP1_g60164 [Rubroshorea leprosula]|uniref:Secreted protein n=1 Tax=Rubroshorea leprosula TaxID=152421 RepID=A0AAV5MVM4_9ROSI|nr:hypothetical protein SLEP1_g60164 [Rubroshorea leprosula]
MLCSSFLRLVTAALVRPFGFVNSKRECLFPRLEAKALLNERDAGSVNCIREEMQDLS